LGVLIASKFDEDNVPCKIKSCDEQNPETVVSKSKIIKKDNDLTILRLARTGQDNLSSLAAVLRALRGVTHSLYKTRSSTLF